MNSWSASVPVTGPQATREFWRIASLPRRSWTDADLASMSATLTQSLRQPDGRQTLLASQAQGLFELAYTPGLFCPMRVGAGKTLVSLLAPVIKRSCRPVLLVPAALVEKTRRDIALYSAHWRVPNHIRLVSYELLGRAQSADLLKAYQPDLLVADEAHRLKNPKAACTKRVVRYLRDAHECSLVAMSGTITKRSLRDFAHLIQLALRPPGCPVPIVWSELEDWAAALDERTDGTRPDPPGALTGLMNDTETRMADRTTAARMAVRRRIVDTHGVVATDETEIDASLHFKIVRPPPMPRVLHDAIEKMIATWETPNGEAFADALTLYRHLREMALGFYYRWDPPAPLSWLEARKAWARTCHAILAHNHRHLDSEKMVASAVDHGHYPEAENVLARWRAVRDTFVPNTVPTWISPYLRDWLQERLEASSHPTIVWIDQVAFAEELARVTAIPYYGQQGLDKRGRLIDDSPAEWHVIASIESNKEGRNLQKFNRSLVVTMPPNGQRIEQIIGRTHRQGQLADEVLVEILIPSNAHERALEQAFLDSRYMQAITGQSQKLLLGDWIEP